jgi:hypothetical protein
MEASRSEELEIFNNLDERKKLYGLYYYIGHAIKKEDFEKISYIKETLLPQITNKKFLYFYFLILLVYSGNLFDKLKQSYDNNDTYEMLVSKLIEIIGNKDSLVYIDYKPSFSALKIINDFYEDVNIRNFISKFKSREDIIFQLDNEKITLITPILSTFFDNEKPIIPTDLKIPTTVSNNVYINEFYSYMRIGGKKSKKSGRKVLKKYPKKK